LPQAALMAQRKPLLVHLAAGRPPDAPVATPTEGKAQA